MIVYYIYPIFDENSEFTKIMFEFTAMQYNYLDDYEDNYILNIENNNIKDRKDDEDDKDDKDDEDDDKEGDNYKISEYLNSIIDKNSDFNKIIFDFTSIDYNYSYLDEDKSSDESDNYYTNMSNNLLLK
jgi:hypothetical protein